MSVLVGVVLYAFLWGWSAQKINDYMGWGEKSAELGVMYGVAWPATGAFFLGLALARWRPERKEPKLLEVEEDELSKAIEEAAQIVAGSPPPAGVKEPLPKPRCAVCGSREQGTHRYDRHYFCWRCAAIREFE